MSSLITGKDPHKRGKALEKVLNELFACYDISVRDSFTISGEKLEEIFRLLETEGDLNRWLKTKIEGALIEKKPFMVVDM